MTSTIPFTPRTTMIVGASSGIGRALAVERAEKGDNLVLVARRSSLLKQIESSLRQDQGPGSADVLSIEADVRDPDAGSEMVHAALERFGRVDTAIYSAGWNVPQRALFETSAESWEAIIDTNLSGAFRLTQALAFAMKQSDGGLIIYISSSGAKRPDKSGAAYQASKAGLAALAHATMEECRDDNVRTTVIYPGTTDTPFVEHRPTPPSSESLAKALRPEDVVAACSFVMELAPRAHVPELLIYPTHS